MLSDFQKNMASRSVAFLQFIDNTLSYKNNVISGVQAVRVATEQKKEYLRALDVAFEFSGSFKGNNFIFSTFNILQCDVIDYSNNRKYGTFHDVKCPLTALDMANAKLVISDYIKENLADIFSDRTTADGRQAITKNFAKLADGVVLKEHQLEEMSVSGIPLKGQPNATFTVNGKDIKLEYQLRLQQLPSVIIFDRGLDIAEPSTNLIALDRFTTAFLHTAPIDCKKKDEKEYTYLPNDPDFTYEQKLSIANFLIYEGFKNALKLNPNDITGIYGEA